MDKHKDIAKLGFIKKERKQDKVSILIWSGDCTVIQLSHDTPKACVPLILVTLERNNAYFLFFYHCLFEENPWHLWGDLPQSIILKEYPEQVGTLSAVPPSPHMTAAVLFKWERLNYLAIFEFTPL